MTDQEKIAELTTQLEAANNVIEKAWAEVPCAGCIRGMVSLADIIRSMAEEHSETLAEYQELSKKNLLLLGKLRGIQEILNA